MTPSVRTRLFENTYDETQALGSMSMRRRGTGHRCALCFAQCAVSVSTEDMSGRSAESVTGTL